jgi:hypothetical protein
MAGRDLQSRPQRFKAETLRTGLQTPSGTEILIWPDGICNPVRNVLRLKRYGRGCKPRPAQKF